MSHITGVTLSLVDIILDKKKNNPLFECPITAMDNLQLSGPKWLYLAVTYGVVWQCQNDKRCPPPTGPLPAETAESFKGDPELDNLVRTLDAVDPGAGFVAVRQAYADLVQKRVDTLNEDKATAFWVSYVDKLSKAIQFAEEFRSELIKQELKERVSMIYLPILVQI